ncbi:uncharacterized protein I303_108331 [Kwoniella dejecticola CBS 10117]|uniref:C2H2-type domain-containing protein n=1 Tax=Kwoniella dejecticola CBS 10117 TaxID=1296121 RepID=A0A1A5ZXP4_9TREE|nr:uncharacterized protein I303_07342 [Kwoniella dejecticola CBS 10117]OBR82581.1 hypothetical protein I303_07342 [Kwoniella dejecticola CBS 10117]
MSVAFHMDPEEGPQAWSLGDNPFNSRTTTAPRPLAVVREEHSKAEDIRKRSQYRQRVCILTAQMRVKLYKHFASTKKAMEERSGERIDTNTVEGLAQICQEVLWETVERSKRHKKDASGHDVDVYMSSQTLNNYRWALQIIVDREWKRRSATQKLSEDFKRFWDSILSYQAELVDTYRLTNVRKHKVALYSQDVAVMIMHSVENPLDSDVAIQFATYILIILHTAVRPSTLLTGKGNDHVFRWEDITFVPRRNSEKVILGFDVIIQFKNFKGYGMASATKIAKNLTLYIRTVRKADNLIFDLGSMLLVHGLRQGAFGPETTIADLFCIEKGRFQVDPSFLKTGVFYAASSRGFGLDKTTSWKTEPARLKFKEIASACGFIAAEGEMIGATSIRRGTATKLVKAFGAMTARIIMGHNPGSNVLEKSYDLSIEQTDLVSAQLQEEGAETVNVRPSYYAIRNRDPREKLRIETAVAQDPRLRLFCHALTVLSECALTGSDMWLQHDLFKQIPDVGSSDVWLMIRKTRRAIKRRMKSLQGEKGRRASAVEATRRDALTVEETMQTAADYDQALKSLSDKVLNNFVSDFDDEDVSEENEGNDRGQEPDVEGEAEVDGEDRNTGESEEAEEEVAEVPDRGFRPVVEGITSDFEVVRNHKFKWMSYLADLKGSADENRRTRQCPKCLAHPYAPIESITKEYNPSQLRKHIQRQHTPYHDTSTWFRGACLGEDKKWKCPFNNCDADYRDESKLRRHITSQHAYKPNCGIPIEIFRNVIYGQLYDPDEATRRRAEPKVRQFYKWTMPAKLEAMDRRYLEKNKYNPAVQYKLARDKRRLESLLPSDCRHLRNLGKQLALGNFS